MRLLPWTGTEGQPCYLSTDDQGSSYMSRLADNLEAVQLGMGESLLGHVRKVLEEGGLSEVELRSMVPSLSTALRDAIRVAESRGNRLPALADDDDARAAYAVIDREVRQ
jgi:hypothetical protein